MDRRNRIRRPLLFLTLCGLSVSSSTAFAHPPGLSGAEVSIARDAIAVVLSFAAQDLETLAPADTDRDAEVSASERAEWATRLMRLAEESLAIMAEGKRYGATGPPRVRFDEDDNVHFDLTFERPPTPSFKLDSVFSTPRGASPVRLGQGLRGPGARRAHAALVVRVLGYAAICHIPQRVRVSYYLVWREEERHLLNQHPRV